LSPLPLKATHPFHDDPHDAFIYIGNEALRLPLDALPHRIDLGEDWKTLTGLPFVFAVWAHAVDPKKEAAETRSEEIARILTEAALRGLQNLSTVCRAGAKRHHLPLELVQSYLTGAIRYGLGPHEQQAVADFGRRLVNHGLLSAAHPLRIAEPHAVDTQRGA
jgi:chorismate dehydratase